MPPPDFSPFPQLEVLEVLGESPTMLDIGLQLPFAFLREVYLREVDVAASVTFLKCHGAKLTKLTAPLDVLVDCDVFRLCLSITSLVVFPPNMKGVEANEVLPEGFFTCSTPQTTLSELKLFSSTLDRRLEPVLKRAFEHFDPASFPQLKEMSMFCIKWPTSEQQARKNRWISLSEALRPRGISLKDWRGVGGTGTGRTL
ncbi:hypothetical protein DFH06DRAFT_379908 [Mycena polygramma]|nr:hypothetical protein DFH06DRAFT_379908 [Mycena polygramma]